MAKSFDIGDPERPPERASILVGLAQRLHEGVRATIDVLTQSHAQRLAALVESSDDAILSVDLDATIATWNRAAQELFGYGADEIIGKSVNTLIPADRQDEEHELLTGISRGEHVRNYETVRLRKDGQAIVVSLSVSPILDSRGAVIGASKIIQDITERKRAEERLARHADEQAALYEFTDRLFRAGSVQENYDAALDAIVRALACERASILLFDDYGVMRFVAWRGLSERYRKAVEGHSPWTPDVTNPQPILVEDIDAADLDAALKATVTAEGIGGLAFIPLTVRGGLVGKFMTYYKARHTFTRSEVDLAVTIARQLGFSLERLRSEGERQKAEEASELLLAESRHRIKNTLSMVQAIARQTLGNGRRDGLDSFLARLRTLDEAHDLLATENWHQAPLRQLVARALKPFQASHQHRIAVEGPALSLPARASLTLTLCLNELATNAVKYGALSNDTGQIRLEWVQVGDGDRRKVRITWQEAGGPPVAVPGRKGFGTHLIQSSGDGESVIDYRPEGVRCLLDLDL